MQPLSIAPQAPVNLTLTNANTEYSLTLPAGCVGFRIQCQTAFDIRIAYVTGKVATPTAPYGIIKSGQVYQSPEGVVPTAMTIYFASAQAGAVVELLAWVRN